MLENQCKKEQDAGVINDNLNLGLYAGAVSSGLTLVASANPFMALSVMDTSQSISNFRLVNRKNSLSLD